MQHNGSTHGQDYTTVQQLTLIRTFTDHDSIYCSCRQTILYKMNGTHDVILTSYSDFTPVTIVTVNNNHELRIMNVHASSCGE